MTHLHTIDHSRITSYFRNYDPNKQYFCLLPYNDTSRPLIVPQEYLIYFDDFLLPCNIPTQIVKPLKVIKDLVSSPLVDKDKSYYTALAKQSAFIQRITYSSNQPNLFHTLYKQNKKQNINPLKLNIPHQFKTLQKNFHQFSIIVLSKI